MSTKRQRGSSTAEVAVLLPAVAALLVVGISAGAVGVTQVRLEEAARAAAREMARGEAGASAISSARRLAGNGADVRVQESGGFVRVTVSTGAPWPLPGGGDGGIRLRADAEARVEGPASERRSAP